MSCHEQTNYNRGIYIQLILALHVLLYWVWRRRLLKYVPLFPLGASPWAPWEPYVPYEQLWVRTPKKDPHIWLKYAPRVLEKKRKNVKVYARRTKSNGSGELKTNLKFKQIINSLHIDPIFSKFGLLFSVLWSFRIW